MDLVLSLAGLLASVAAGIIGHFIAHDLYSATPRYAKRLLAYAVKLLPEPDRKRYEEEWLAHLQERAGAISKLRHAVECLCVARKLGQIVARRITVEPHAIEFSFSSNGQKIATVSMDSVTALPLLTMMDEVDNLERPIEPKKFVASKELEELFANPEVQRANPSAKARATKNRS